MKRPFMVMMLLLGVGAGELAAAEPYADKVKITATTTPMGQMVIKDARVPDRALVGIPPYPGAKVFQTRGAGAMKLNGKDALPYIKLLSSDKMDKVVEWYKRKLPSYHYQKQGFAGMFTHIFWKKKGKYGMFDIDARLLNVNVGISDGSMHKDDYPKSRTMVEMTYQPKK